MMALKIALFIILCLLSSKIMLAFQLPTFSKLIRSTNNKVNSLVTEKEKENFQQNTEKQSEKNDPIPIYDLTITEIETEKTVTTAETLTEKTVKFQQAIDAKSKQDGPALNEILKRNQEWAAAKRKGNPTYFSDLAKRQSPRYLWIGCSDSRVPPEMLMQTDPGEVFVHRNIANQVMIEDKNFASVLTYAVEHLKVEDIIVCGHYKCGGVLGASSPGNLGRNLETWIGDLREVVKISEPIVTDVKDEDERQKKLVEINTQIGCLKLLNNPMIKEAQEKNDGVPRIHGLVFDIEKGFLLDVDYDNDYLRQFVEDPSSVYDRTGNLKMAPRRRSKRGRLSSFFKKIFGSKTNEGVSIPTRYSDITLPVSATAKMKEGTLKDMAPMEETEDYKRLEAWLLYIGCPEYTTALYKAGFTNFDNIVRFGISEQNLERIVPEGQKYFKKLITMGYHAEFH